MLEVLRGSLRIPRAIQHASHGVGRRISILRVNFISLLRGCERPPESPLYGDPGHELCTHLNSFYIHLHGMLDNLAWMIAHELNMFGGVSEDDYSARRRVGLFKFAFQEALGQALVNDFLNSKKCWYDATKDWRDPIAHRIPLYAVPCVLTNADQDRFKQLEELEMDALKQGLAGLSEKYHEQKMNLGTYHPIFAHETSGTPVPIKEQVEEDARNLLDFLWFFIENDWVER